ncbi:hypothetical protein [Lactiplantibacillus pentosus]|uniref:hypothetical protein n=1 Tax=Lactiplantibacillus pentosus TaxID=1589 RepID=UPI001330CA0E|nr:hypothetical protein [Lactiplantibacillus pentosus]MBQ0835499.1 hypothetical protein [Lactiplantibacillus pentosus]MBU7464953.1 hypothetical protein [Lactiplantibacillus pentosus]MBU7490957.1 hypothetical protein [Lactiplantibacillus pentosus]MBU7493959.1 hypothetical protein [Lactiplantibacillus pentosus]MBU7519953.1 hypothetical protein [Lactiplantibacillus pentosus]
MSEFNDLISCFELPPKLQIGNFSKGMKMQLNVAVGLSHSADLLVLDEITSGLDPIMRVTILKTIKAYVSDNVGTGVILITHNLDDVNQICNRLVVLDHGSKILDKHLSNIDKNNLLEVFEKTIGRSEKHDWNDFKGYHSNSK